MSTKSNKTHAFIILSGTLLACVVVAAIYYLAIYSQNKNEIVERNFRHLEAASDRIESAMRHIYSILDSVVVHERQYCEHLLKDSQEPGENTNNIQQTNFEELQPDNADTGAVKVLIESANNYIADLQEMEQDRANILQAIKQKLGSFFNASNGTPRPRVSIVFAGRDGTPSLFNQITEDQARLTRVLDSFQNCAGSLKAIFDTLLVKSDKFRNPVNALREQLEALEAKYNTTVNKLTSFKYPTTVLKVINDLPHVSILTYEYRAPDTNDTVVPTDAPDHLFKPSRMLPSGELELEYTRKISEDLRLFLTVQIDLGKLIAASARGMNFDNIWTVQNDGSVLYPRESSTGAIRKFDTLLQSTENAKEVSYKEVAHKSKLLTTRLYGAKQFIFTHPLMIEIPGEDSTDKSLTLIGSMSSERLNDESLNIPSNQLLWLILIGLLTLCAWPVLDTLSTGRHTRISRSRTLLMVFATLVGAAAFGTALWDWLTMSELKDRHDTHIRNIAGVVHDKLISEFEQAHKQLMFFTDSVFRLQVEDERVIRTVTSVQSLSKDSSVVYKHQIGFPYSSFFFTNKLQDGTTGARGNNSGWHYTNFERVFLVSPQGIKQYSIETDSARFPVANLNNRPYVQAARNRRLWRFTPPTTNADSQAFELAVDVHYSWSTSKYETTIAVPLEITRDNTSLSYVAAMDIDTVQTFNNMALPQDYSVAVLDADGQIVYHSDNQKSGSEHFQQECNWDRDLAGLLNARTAEVITIKYLGKFKRLFTMPIQGSNWTVVAYYDVESWIHDLNFTALATATVFGLLTFVLLIAVLTLIVTVPGLSATALWPDPNGTSVYLFLAGLIALTFLFLLCCPSLWDADNTMVLAVTLPTFVLVFVYLSLYRRHHYHRAFGTLYFMFTLYFPVIVILQSGGSLTQALLLVLGAMALVGILLLRRWPGLATVLSEKLEVEKAGKVVKWIVVKFALKNTKEAAGAIAGDSKDERQSGSGDVQNGDNGSKHQNSGINIGIQAWRIYLPLAGTLVSVVTLFCFIYLVLVAETLPASVVLVNLMVCILTLTAGYFISRTNTVPIAGDSTEEENLADTTPQGRYYASDLAYVNKHRIMIFTMALSIGFIPVLVLFELSLDAALHSSLIEGQQDLAGKVFDLHAGAKNSTPHAVNESCYEGTTDVFFTTKMTFYPATDPTGASLYQSAESRNGNIAFGQIVRDVFLRMELQSSQSRKNGYLLQNMAQDSSRVVRLTNYSPKALCTVHTDPGGNVVYSESSIFNFSLCNFAHTDLKSWIRLVVAMAGLLIAYVIIFHISRHFYRRVVLWELFPISRRGIPAETLYDVILQCIKARQESRNNHNNCKPLYIVYRPLTPVEDFREPLIKWFQSKSVETKVTIKSIEDIIELSEHPGIYSVKKSTFLVDAFDLEAIVTEKNQTFLIAVNKLHKLCNIQIVILGSITPANAFLPDDFGSEGPSQPKSDAAKAEGAESKKGHPTPATLVNIANSFADWDVKYSRDNPLEASFNPENSNDMVSSFRTRNSGKYDTFSLDKLEVLLLEECRFAPWMRRLVNSILAEADNRKLLFTRELLLNTILLQAKPFHLSCWHSCSRSEKIILANLAKEGLINGKDPVDTLSLLNRRIISFAPHPQILSPSFEQFLRGKDIQEEAQTHEQQAGKGSWEVLRYPIIAIMLFAAGLLVVTQQDFVDTTLALSASASTILGVFVKWVSGFKTPKLPFA